MNYEEKYKEALEKAQIYRNHLIETGDDYKEIEYIFPELRESDDEIIRKTLIRLFTANNTEQYGSVTNKQIVSWLEKQGKQNKQQLYDVPDTSIKDSEAVTSRIKYIDENLKPIAEFIIGYANWDLRKDEWNHPVATVPLFRVLDALVQNGKQYSEEHHVVDNNTEPKFNVGDFVHCTTINGFEYTYIYKSNHGDVIHAFVIYSCGTHGVVSIDDMLFEPSIYTKRKATTEEIITLLQSIHKNGFIWDAEKKELKKIEQKPTDNVEPKFKVGDWITNGDYTWKIVEVKPLDYILQSQDGNIVDDNISHVDGNFSLWTIEDAKDGDVLYCDNGNNKTIYLFKEQRGSSNIANAYFQILNMNNKQRLLFDKAADFNLNTKPATKEQCDILFQKMYDAGYTWNAKTKQLIKK